ncbi:hypothetical protein [uncultured Sulfitobacter sp.]|uniref:GntT/GntP/DsdX family permease n=1 Tax=uncultured Sulfitobacter sp. TaxID=191468 RepID=UPI0026347613|nr:hypothetical protein [uncultured Sulfitobacter sp.]
MTDVNTAKAETPSRSRLVPDLPLVVWMVALTLILGLGSGMGSVDLVAAYNLGFGRALGEFALILLPSFTLAAALSRQNVASEAAGRATAFASPVAGAGMICPDTAYAALSPAAGRYKLELAFGAYAGFKLLYPAGPLIVAAGLGTAVTEAVPPVTLLFAGVLLTVPVWMTGLFWARYSNKAVESAPIAATEQTSAGLILTFAPFLVMTALLIVGGVVGQTGIGIIDFLLMPKGALLCAAILALLQTPHKARRECLDSAVRRTGSLLLVIGAASAFGGVLTMLVPLDRLVPNGSGLVTLLALFALTVIFKLAQGSSMATFAAVAPVAAPIVVVSGAEPIAAVFAICLGSFIAILPNDSYYWLVRRDALEHETSEARAIRILTGGAILQACIGMALLLSVVAVWT